LAVSDKPNELAESAAASHEADVLASVPSPDAGPAGNQTPAAEHSPPGAAWQPEGGEGAESRRPEPELSGSSEVTAQESQPQTAASDGEEKLEWYILKVQSNRENSIAEALQRRVAVEGLGAYFGQIIVPTEKVSEFKGGKKRIVRRKLYPGYILVQMRITDDTWFLVRETPGIGDFTGAGGKPTPMLPHEVQRIIARQEEKIDEAPKLKINFKTGDRVKINEGTFENFEGEVSSLDEASGRVIVMINIFGRSTPVELEYWQVELV
jgi:transcriptional antiterminator NusG